MRAPAARGTAALASDAQIGYGLWGLGVRTRLIELLGASVMLAACGNGVDADDGGPAGNGNGEGNAVVLSFQPSAPLEVMPRESYELTVLTSPPAEYSVRFALLAAENGGPADALLDKNESATDAAGTAHVTLTAPSGPTNFAVRASIEGSTPTTLAVSVGASGKAELEVKPSYSGSRGIASWIATVRTEVTCDELMGPLVGTDGEAFASAEPPAWPIVTAPVGPELAVSLRAGQYVSGCATVTDVEEGARNLVVVPVTDLPIQLDKTALALSLGFDQASPAWNAELEQVIEQGKLALLGAALDDLEAVLDAMQQVVPEAQADAFSEARVNRGWDAALKVAYPDAASILRDGAGAWLSAGLSGLYTPDLIQGALAADESDVERAFLSLDEVAGVPAAQAGFPEMAAASWSADSQDTLVVSSNVPWSPSRLLAVLSYAPASAQYTAAPTVPAALSKLLDCGLFAGTLLGAGQPHELYPGCIQACAELACEDALSLLWSRLAALSDDARPLLALSASGHAVVGEEAEITGLTGSWVGRFSSDNDAATAGGPFSGD